MADIKWVIVVLILVLGSFFLLPIKLADIPWTVLPDEKKEIPKLIEIAKEVKREVPLPVPLRIKKTIPVSVLTRVGIISQTNLQRNAEGHTELSENAKLNKVASLKVADMFSRQYFAHESPTGEHASNLVGRFEYQYLSVGENLALGNFLNDKDLVEAWMNSPGHRANILDSGFSEIGVAVEKGVFEGEETWLAVQIFALPQSACPQPDENLKLFIDSSKLQIDEFTEATDALRMQITYEKPKTKKEVEEYNKTIGQYNALVKSINALIDEMKIAISKYNAQVRALNACAVR